MDDCLSIGSQIWFIETKINLVILQLIRKNTEAAKIEHNSILKLISKTQLFSFNSRMDELLEFIIKNNSKSNLEDVIKTSVEFLLPFP